MKRRRMPTLTVVLALIAALALVWSLRVVIPWVDRTAVFVTFFAVMALLVVLMDCLIVLVGPGLWRFTRSLPTHRIEPNVDAEQAYVVQDLTRTGQAALLDRVRVTQPLSGTNAQGDQWFTQGYASVLRSVR